MLVQRVGGGAGGAVEWGTAAARVAGGVAAGADAQGGCGRAPGPRGHCLPGVAEVPRGAVGKAEVAQDVGGAVAFCAGDTHTGGEAKARRPAGPPAPGCTRTLPAAAASQQAGRATPGTHPGTAPLCPAAHTRCWSPGGPGAAPTCPRPSHTAAACSGTASLGMGCGGHGEEGERLLAAWSCPSGPLSPATRPRAAVPDPDGAQAEHPLCTGHRTPMGTYDAPDTPARPLGETAGSPLAVGYPGGSRARGPSLRAALTRVEIVALIFQAQSPQALRVLVPEVGGHEDPVVVALATDIQGSGTEGGGGGWSGPRVGCREGSHGVGGRARGAGVWPEQTPPPRPALSICPRPGPPPWYLMATSVERVPMGLVSEISRSPRRL